MKSESHTADIRYLSTSKRLNFINHVEMKTLSLNYVIYSFVVFHFPLSLVSVKPALQMYNHITVKRDNQKTMILKITFYKKMYC